MEKILEKAYQHASKQPNKQFVTNSKMNALIDSICKCEGSKAPIRYLMSAMLAKIYNKSIDTRQPYPKLGNRSFAGRTIDENIIQRFIHRYQLPCNDTTAFLTPAFRTLETAITKSSFEKCRPAFVYNNMMDILDYVEMHPTTAISILTQIIADLILIKQATENRVAQLIEGISSDQESALSSEEITTLLQQHLKCRGSSRLPVLMVVAAYQAVQHLTKENHKPLFAHNAADSQTGAIGDIEIMLQGDDATVTCYEMKKKRVSTDDIYVCVEKIVKLPQRPDNYIIITTERIDEEVKELATSFYNKIEVEIAVLDCLGFINHFLHFFHRYRTSFLDHYQQLVLDEPTSAVSQPLKEAFLSLRRVAEIRE
ncbi:MAG: restriction endonuclease, SacI family [Bacteroidaceae bacterium]|nr:restriction endonuclease, SacI family [Bacteroidaceae bacterium]